MDNFISFSKEDRKGGPGYTNKFKDQFLPCKENKKI